MNNDDMYIRINRLFKTQKLGVLATQQQDHPYTSLIAFAAAENLCRIVFATPKNSHKFKNITANQNVSLFIDNRLNESIDFEKAIGVTVLGTAIQIPKNTELMNLYLEKHPQLNSFAASSECAFFCIDVNSMYVVEKFQSVTMINPKNK